MTPDGSNTITHHPSVFQLQHMDRHHNGSSTSVEHAPSPRPSDAVERHTAHPNDVEGQVIYGRNVRFPRVSTESDPYGLSSAYKTDSDLDQIKANISRKRDGAADSNPDSRRGSIAAAISNGAKANPLTGPKRDARKVQGFYENQNATIERMLKSVDEHRDEARQEAGDDQF